MKIKDVTRIANTINDGTTRKAVQSLSEHFQLLYDALQGEMNLTISPTTCTEEAKSTAWTRNVYLALVNNEGKVHEWCNMALTTRLAIADTSQAGASTIASTTLTFVDGRATIVVTSSAHAWEADETNTLTVSALSIAGYTVAGGTSVCTIIAAE